MSQSDLNSSYTSVPTVMRAYFQEELISRIKGPFWLNFVKE